MASEAEPRPFDDEEIRENTTLGFEHRIAL